LPTLLGFHALKKVKRAEIRPLASRLRGHNRAKLHEFCCDIGPTFSPEVDVFPFRELLAEARKMLLTQTPSDVNVPIERHRIA
jgi:hypothetical protein